jgi:tetratricopeptide (TPR) repeat protein
MELLKKFGILQLLLIMLLSGKVYGQGFDKQIKAFQESYISEASGEYTVAINKLREVYSENSYEINLRLGYLCYLSGKFTESIAYYNKSISLLPLSIEARLGYVLPAAAMGNYNQVLTQYAKILEITPNNSIVMHRIGLIYYGKENYTEAEKYFEKVVNLYPFDYDALTMLAWTKYRLGKTREAKVLFYKALLNTPNGSSATEGLDILSRTE